MKKTVLITGSSSGIGKSILEHLISKGFSVYGTSRNPQPGNQLWDLLAVDVTKPGTIQSAVEKIMNLEGRIDVLICNAGMGIGGSIECTPEEDAKLQMETNFQGTANTIRAVLPVMRKQRGGTIILMGSIGGLTGLPYQGYYSASKFALEGLAEALRMELLPSNIHVVIINPGDFRTNFTANRRVSTMETLPEYGSQFSKTLAIIEKDESSGLDPIIIARKIENIIHSKNPKGRYIIATLEQKLAVYLKYILPTGIYCRILASHYGIKKAN
jgi:NAD(P)-dependent dehydrogenase (short-subunit alcohol dehydrogenase family)